MRNLFFYLDKQNPFPPHFPLHIKSSDEYVKKKRWSCSWKLLYSINMAAAAPMIGASSLASAVGAMAKPVEDVVT